MICQLSFRNEGSGIHVRAFAHIISWCYSNAQVPSPRLPRLVPRWLQVPPPEGRLQR